MKSALLVLLGVALRASAQVASNEPCPKVGVAQNFDQHKVAAYLKEAVSIANFIYSGFFFLPFSSVFGALVRGGELSGRVRAEQELRDGPLLAAAGRCRDPSRQSQFQHEVNKTVCY